MSSLIIDKVVKRFGGLVAVDEVSLELPPGGHIIGLMGPNGAGKTTLFNCVTGHLNPEGGDVRIGTESVLSMKPHERAEAGIGRTFQRLAVFSTMTVEENIQVAVETQTPGRVLRGLFKINHKTDDDVAKRTDELIKFMRLEDVRHDVVGGLPTGVSRLVEMGRALAIDPTFILLDEPASGLDSTETKFFEQVLLDVKNSGVSLLLVEHDVDLVLGLCEHIYVMEFGKPIASGTPDEIVNNADVRSAYLGQPHDEDDSEGSVDEEVVDVASA